MGKFGFITLFIMMLLTACSTNDDSTKQANDNEPKQQDIEKKDNSNDEFYQEENHVGETNEIDEDPNGVSEGIVENEKIPDENGIVTVSNPNDIHVVVNKQRSLPEGYVPPDLVEPNVPFSFSEWNEKRQIRKVAAQALEELFEGAEEAGLDLVAVSGYRSQSTQEYLFNYYVETQGLEHAQIYSARPGHSEHQTGLTMDVDSAVQTTNLEESFRQTAEGEWLEKHAHEYGFVIRYPKGKEDITGYAYEPWHIRYVGKNVAQEIYTNQLTLEEYFGFYE